MSGDQVKRESQKFERKWSPKIAKFGHVEVPNLLITLRKELGLKAPELLILIVICYWYWAEGEQPFPSQRTLAEFTGMSERIVNRYIGSLELKGLLKKKRRWGSSNSYDLSPLITILDNAASMFLLRRNVPTKLRHKVVSITEEMAGYKNPLIENPGEEDAPQKRRRASRPP
jgi:Helix-turn-helix domain